MNIILGELLKNLKIIMKKYKPRDHGENRMNQEGDVLLARNNFYSNDNKNLNFLLKNRFSKEFILNENYKITDFSMYEYLDYKAIDALDTKFDNEAFDFIISSNMIHHLPYPMRFFKEINRILKPGGVISKTFYIPLPGIFLKMHKKIDNVLSQFFPKVFSLQRQIALEKK